MSDPITDHKLELLAAGALDPQESARLLERLDALPQARAKLDALIEANEAFLKEYPAQYMLPHILRRAHEAPHPTPKARKMKKLQAPLYGFAAIAALALVIAGISQLYDAEQESSKHPIAQTPQPEPTKKAAKAPATAAPKPQALPKLWEQGELLFQRGEERYFMAKGVAKINIENNVLRPKDVQQDKDILSFVALRDGLSTVELQYKDQQLMRYARVAPATPEAVIDAALKSGVVRVPQTCLNGKPLGDRQFRLVVDPKGAVMVAQLDNKQDLSPERLDCLIKAAKSWSFNTQDSSAFTIAVLSLEL